MLSLPTPATPLTPAACDGLSQVSTVLAVLLTAHCLIAVAWILGTVLWDDVVARTSRRDPTR